jgi:hypothetical protein
MHQVIDMVKLNVGRVFVSGNLVEADAVFREICITLLIFIIILNFRQRFVEFNEFSTEQINAAMESFCKMVGGIYFLWKK